MHVFQTPGVPPSRGRIILPIIGWTKNKSAALTKRVNAKRKSKEHLDVQTRPADSGCRDKR